MNLAFAALLQTSLLVTGASPTTYKDAYAAAADSGKPLVVLVGTDWCPGCQTMKLSVMPQIKREGGLKQVEFVQVNSDQDSQLAGKLMQGSSIPQLIIFWKTAKGWEREQLTGAHSTDEVKQFISQGKLAQKAPETAIKPVASRSE